MCWGIVVVEAVCDYCGVATCSLELKAGIPLKSVQLVISYIVTPLDGFVVIKCSSLLAVFVPVHLVVRFVIFIFVLVAVVVAVCVFFVCIVA